MFADEFKKYKKKTGYSDEKIKTIIYDRTGKSYSLNTIRNWKTNRSVPNYNEGIRVLSCLKIIDTSKSMNV